MPVITENDSIVTDEISVGDNDTLAAIVGRKVGADLLIVLSDIDGLYTANPREIRTPKSSTCIFITPEIYDLRATGERSWVPAHGHQDSGGRDCHGCRHRYDHCQRNTPENLYRILDGEKVGTKFRGKKQIG